MSTNVTPKNPTRTINAETAELRSILEELYFTLEEAVDAPKNAWSEESLDQVRERYMTALRCVRAIETRYDLDTGKLHPAREDA